MTNNEIKTTDQSVKELTFDEVIYAFELWATLQSAGALKDSMRYDADLLKHYPEITHPKAPLVLMFNAFVGAIDLVELFESEKFDRALKQLMQEREAYSAMLDAENRRENKQTVSEYLKARANTQAQKRIKKAYNEYVEGMEPQKENKEEAATK